MTAVVPWARDSGRMSPQPMTFTELVELADRVSGVAGFVPAALLNNPAGVLATLLAGNELGIPPMTSLRAIHVIEGRVALSAEIARALVFAAGHRIDILESDDHRCLVRVQRRDSNSSTTVEWTMDRARRAKLDGRANWIRYPRQMLKARATGEACRDLFPDTLAGLEVMADEDDELVSGSDSAEATPEPARRTFKANVQQRDLGKPASSAATTSVPTDPPAPSAPTAQEPVAEDTAVSTGGDVQTSLPVEPPPSDEPPPPPPPEDLAEVHDIHGGLPAWQRRLHARVSEVFSGQHDDLDDFRHSIVAVVTRNRDDGTGPVSSSSLLTTAEQWSFDAILNNIEHGMCLIARLGDGRIEIRQAGWIYRVRLQPLEVTTTREAG